MKDLYEEGIKQFRNNPLLSTYYAYYILHCNKTSTKKKENDSVPNKEVNEKNIDYTKSLQEKCYAKDDSNPSSIIKVAIGYKINIFGKYFIEYLIFELKEKEKEDNDFSKKESFEDFMNLQYKALECHLSTLNLLKKYFNIINSPKEERTSRFNQEKFYETIYTYIQETNKLYQDTINKYPNEKSTYELYNLFLNEIVNPEDDSGNDELNEAFSHMALNIPDQPSGNNNDNGISSMKSYLKNSQSNEDMKSKKIKLLKKNMLTAFTKVHSKSSKIILILFTLIVGFFVVIVCYSFVFINNLNNNITDLKSIGDMNYNVDRLIRRSRIIGFFIMEENLNDAESIRLGILETIVRLEDKYLPVLKKYSSEEASTTPVLVYYNEMKNGTASNDYIHYNGYELMSEIILWAKELYNTPTEQLILNEKTGKKIFDNRYYRTLSDNIVNQNFKFITEETFEKIYANSIANQNSKMLIIYILTIIFAVMSLALNLLGITPIQRDVNNLINNITKLFNYIPRGSLKDIVSKYDDSIESITQLYDINFNYKKEGRINIEDNTLSRRLTKKFKGYIINLILIISILLIVLPIVIKKSYLDDHVEYILRSAERKEMIIDLNLYALETIIHDTRTFTPGSAESLLDDVINRMGTMQTQIYSGAFGLEPTKEMRSLDFLLIKYGCRIEQSKCEGIEENVNIGFTKKVITSPMNNLIDEYLEKSKSILQKSLVGKYRTINHIYHSEVDNDRFRKYCLGDPDFLFQYKVITHCINGLDKFYNALFDSQFETVRSALYSMIIFIFIDSFLLFISYVISYRSIISNSKILCEIVNVVFLIPEDIINMVPQLKRFIDTASFEE
ncbi:hypothetical protein BCR32DRAFT_147198 [Anaeromyces robustus]|uniref:Uncharacterized protein n=1 Tax=Anaeromyces robustus TaxID=1754192 RepID=A0A1Y1XPC1_9FUNG|nr:hypothetical protein BCR32DRAFT_147198 [Anaeromyces robustus]|eukprot:ORX87598.1 hypothetical protein BCR32DRAFT_147198 [Anaeromyces robustus]